MESDARTSERETSLSSPPPTDSDIDVNIGLDIDSDVNSDSETATAQSNTASESQTNNEQKIEWLATTRERRSTAGNRMKSMLANEEPDSDLELLFAEDEDDEGFSEVDDGGLDVHMDSSDDEDENDDDDNLEGEKELEKQARERTAAQRKRKAQEAIPAKFRKKVRIDPITKPPAASTTPAPRPRKKSERTSWLPSVADLPTRASSRQTTRTSKEQLHQQMVEREARRLKQLAQMQKKAERLEASRKPPMTQEERLREAALVEKRNSKSLNRWEVAEKHREEERRAKLAALNNRTLKGPVMTFWSGIGELIGRRLVVEEPVKEKRKRGDKSKDRDKGKEKDKKNTNGSVEDGLLKQEASQDGAPAASGAAKPEPNPEIPGQLLSQPQPPLAVPTEPTNLTQSSSTNTPNLVPAQIDPVSKSTCPAETVGEGLVETGSTAPAATTPADKSEETSRPLATSSPPTSSMLAPPANITLSTTTSVSSHSPLAPPASGLVAPAPRLNAHRPVMAMVAPQPGLARASESKPSGVLAAPVLAPPAGIGMNGVVPPVLGYGTSTSNILAPPNTSQTLMPPTMSSIPTVAPPSIPPPIAAPSPGPGSEPSKPKLAPGPATTLADAPSKGSMKDTLTEPASYHLVKTSQLNGADSVANNTHPPPPTPSTGARNAIIFQNFDENAIKDRGIQTQILFGRKMNKLASMISYFTPRVESEPANTLIKNQLLPPFVSSRTTQLVTVTLAQACPTTTHMHTARFNACAAVNTTGVVSWALGLAAGRLLPEVYRHVFCTQRKSTRTQRRTQHLVMSLRKCR